MEVIKMNQRLKDAIEDGIRGTFVVFVYMFLALLIVGLVYVIFIVPSFRYMFFIAVVSFVIITASSYFKNKSNDY